MVDYKIKIDENMYLNATKSNCNLCSNTLYLTSRSTFSVFSCTALGADSGDTFMHIQGFSNDHNGWNNKYCLLDNATKAAELKLDSGVHKTHLEAEANQMSLLYILRRGLKSISRLAQKVNQAMSVRETLSSFATQFDSSRGQLTHQKGH